MSWTAPTTRTTGNLITASIWNTDLVNNLLYLKNAPTFDGLITVSGAGTSAFSAASSTGVAVRVTNSTSGTTAYAQSDLVAGTAQGGHTLYSQGFTTSGYSVAAGLTLYSLGAGGINIAADNSSATINFFAGGSVQSARMLGFGTYALGTRAATIEAFGGAAGTGDVAGAMMIAGRNSSGNGAAGLIGHTAKDGTIYYTWADATGVLRISTTPPHEDGSPSDTGGTIVGTQTSTRASKIIDGQFTDAKKALRTLRNTPLYCFRYKNGAYNHQRFVGITTDDSPMFGMDKGRCFNPVNAFGYTVAAIQELARKLDRLEAVR